MRSTHRITLAVALAASAVAGTAAATQTVHLGADHASPPKVSASALAAQKAKLNAADRSIDAALRARPPALPKVPRFKELGEPSVPPAVVTRVVPSPSAASAAATTTADAPDPAPADDAPATSPTTPAAPAAAAPARTPEHVGDDDGEDHHATGGDDDEGEDHAEDRRGSDTGSRDSGSEHGGED